MKLTISQLGTPKDIQTKYGLKQKSYIKAKEYGEKYLNYWLSSSTTSWKVNDVIDVEKVEEGEYNGKPQYNIILPKKTPNNTPVEVMALSSKLSQIQTQLRSILDHLSGKNRLDTTSDGTKVPDFSEVDGIPSTIPLEDIPF